MHLPFLKYLKYRRENKLVSPLAQSKVKAYQENGKVNAKARVL